VDLSHHRTVFPLVLLHCCCPVHAFGGPERHGLDQAEPVALVAIELAGDAGLAIAALDRRNARLQQLVAEEGALVDLAGHARCGRHDLDAVAEALFQLARVAQHQLVGILRDLQLGLGLFVRDDVEHLALKPFPFMLPVKAPVWA
jgi:hypothetical protein